MVSGQKSHADRCAANTAQRVDLNAAPLKFGEILKFQSGAVVFSSVFEAAFRRVDGGCAILHDAHRVKLH